MQFHGWPLSVLSHQQAGRARSHMAVALSRRVLSRPLARAALRPLGTAAADVEQSFSLALSEEQQAFKDAVRLPPLPTRYHCRSRHTRYHCRETHPTTTTGRHASLRRRR